MSGAVEILEILLHGVAIGALGATAFGFGRYEASHSVRISGVLFCVTIIAYAIISSDLIRNAIGPSHVVLRILSFGGVGAFWTFVRVLFEDRRLSPLLFAPYAGLTLLGAAASLTPAEIQPGLWIVHNLAEVSLAGFALFVIWRSWRGDLVEARRRLRGPFLAGAALFIVTLSGFEIGEELGIAADWYPMAGAAALAAFSLAGTVVMFQVRPALFGAAVARPVNVEEIAGPNVADRAEMARVTALMDGGEAWRREGLTIGVLAQDLQIPEHRLRRLINDHLGHRNFASFVNARRIDAAKRLLSDPAEARKTVSSIAFDLGFGSLGPFNRAFKEATGQTPTEWRRCALEGSSPNPKKPR
ncbi:MAG: helix-turn-helix domain-containing protein [Hyphomonadaceae bacterium]|nr:helix-turn-helix domain-containing protein [Hyphomonadaceae bacterium]